MGAAFCILFLNLMLWIKLIWIIIISASLIFNVYWNCSPHKQSIVKIYQTQNGWQLSNRKGELLEAQLQGDSIVTRYLVILNFSINGKSWRKTLLLFPDMFDKRTFRRLRVQLYNIF